MMNAAMMLLLFVSVPLTLAEDAALPDALKSAEDKEESNNFASYKDEDEVVAEEGSEESVQLAEVDESQFSVEDEVLSAGNSGLLNSEQGISADIFSRRRVSTTPTAAPATGSLCCQCVNGKYAWSASGACSPCGGKVSKKVRAPAQCQKGAPGLNNKACASQCRNILSGGSTTGSPTSPCNAATSGTCKFSGCAKSRGPTQCVKGKCVCKAGSCSDGKMCKAAVR
ncbi:unnamed protein product [Polarella glacialis]|nr:unnamed protein product [Polarella glacialis]